jgi:hypothetical protein
MTTTSDPFHPEQLTILDAPDWQDVHFLEDRLYEYKVARTVSRMAACWRSSCVILKKPSLPGCMAGPGVAAAR